VRTIAENATLGLFMMDAHQRCTFMNPAAEKITGFTFDEIQALDRPLHELVHHTRPDGSRYPMEECPIDRALPRKSQEQGEDVFVRKDGSFYHVAFTASPILDGDVPVGTVIEIRDITEQKRAEAERERLIAALERSNKELDQFAYVASHDLKAPLRGIANLAQWIEEDLSGTLEGESRYCTLSQVYFSFIRFGDLCCHVGIHKPPVRCAQEYVAGGGEKVTGKLNLDKLSTPTQIIWTCRIGRRGHPSRA
jgi:PAS domain S-box-containing protein